MATGPWIYPAEMLEALARHGLAPAPATPPLAVRAALNDLYRYELRRLRRRYLEGRFDKPSLHAQVVALRKQYWLLTLPPPAWERICAGP
jgi:hypothetical protein